MSFDGFGLVILMGVLLIGAVVGGAAGITYGRHEACYSACYPEAVRDTRPQRVVPLRIRRQPMNARQRRKASRMVARTMPSTIPCADCSDFEDLMDSLAVVGGGACYETGAIGQRHCSVCNDTGVLDDDGPTPWSWVVEELRASRQTKHEHRRWLLMVRRTRQCPRCGGHGLEPSAPDHNCGTCYGEGRVKRA